MEVVDGAFNLADPAMDEGDIQPLRRKRAAAQTTRPRRDRIGRLGRGFVFLLLFASP